MRQPLLKISNLEGGYGDIKILNGVNIEVPEKSIVTIVGPNGAGKSTILKAIFGIARVTAGTATIFRDGKEVNVFATKPYNLSKIGIGYVPQIENIFVGMTIDENLDVGYIPESGKSLEELKESMYVSCLLYTSDAADD
jgi:ABC-type branched-subunit amino acid transport system ATPase component